MMPRMNYCKKCKAEVPAGENCPFCGGKLARTGERLSFGYARTVARDWFAWNAALRVTLPVLGVVLLLTLALEAVVSGAQGVAALLEGGFLGTLLWALGGMLLACFAVLCLQGKESVHYVLDAQGVHVYTYLDRVTKRRLWARMLTEESVAALQIPELAVPGFTLVRRTDLPWAYIRRVRFWPEARTILCFRPSLWLAAALRCPETEYAEAEATLRKRMKRIPKAKVQPQMK